MLLVNWRLFQKQLSRWIEMIHGTDRHHTVYKSGRQRDFPLRSSGRRWAPKIGRHSPAPALPGVGATSTRSAPHLLQNGSSNHCSRRNQGRSPMPRSFARKTAAIGVNARVAAISIAQASAKRQPLWSLYRSFGLTARLPDCYAVSHRYCPRNVPAEENNHVVTGYARDLLGRRSWEAYYRLSQIRSEIME